jgi:hypothetical protein
MNLDGLLRGALARATDAGRLGVKSKDLTEAELDQLLTLCVNFLWARRTEQSPIEGWWLSAGGIRPCGRRRRNSTIGRH